MNQENFQKGDRVQISTTKEGIIQGTFSHTTPAGVGYVHGDNGKSYERVFSKIVKIGESKTSFEVSNDSPQTPKQKSSFDKIAEKFDINTRFKFLSSFVRMTIKRQRVSLIITGEGGLGKSYTVDEQLLMMGLKKDIDYIKIKGFSTAKGLYNTLYENLDKLIIFDDCDEILTNDVAKNLLKGALDSYDTREVCWITNNPYSEIPNNFIFEGAIIFISNMSKHKIDQAILSRATNVDLTMSLEDKMERMRMISQSKSFKSGVSQEFKDEAFEFLCEFKDECKNLNFRTLIEIVDFRASGEENWKELAEYSILAG